MALKNEAILLEFKAIMKMRPSKKNHKGKAIISKENPKLVKRLYHLTMKPAFNVLI